MKKEFSERLIKYIDRIKDISDLDRATIEKVINIQIVTLLGDLAINESSETFLGKLLIEDNKVDFEISEVIKEMVNGDINPLYVLMEILNG